MKRTFIALLVCLFYLGVSDNLLSILDKHYVFSTESIMIGAIGALIITIIINPPE